MPRFTLSKLFTAWTDVATPPKMAGWYRTRQEPLTHSWWSGMAFFDGSTWWEFRSHAGMGVRREVKVLQWQGLVCPFAEAVERIRAQRPKSARTRRAYERFIAGAT